MKDTHQIALTLDIFIHLMTSAYREGYRSGRAAGPSEPEHECHSAAEQFRHGMLGMFREPESCLQH